jgi:phospholipase A1
LFASHQRLAKLPIVLLSLAAALAGWLTAAPQDDAAAGKKEDKPSYFSRLWQLDEASRAAKSSIAFHRSNYALAYSYNTSPNLDPWLEVDPDKTLKNEEVTFQISVKARLWKDVFKKPMDLWFGYTQRSFWQLYNVEDSSPFRETNYEPEFLLNFRTHFKVLGLKGRFVQVGLNHQSNGQVEPVSRSWNRIVANVGLESGPFSLLVKGWYKFPESAEDDDNPGINKYMGFGEVWGYYFLKRHRFGIMVRDNLDFQENYGALQLEWSFPVFGDFAGYVQYFLGYGESLIDYDHRVNRIGVGFMVMDWD